MKRREVLWGLGGAVALGGCTSDDSVGEPTTVSPTRAPVDAALDVESVDCANGTDEATVAFEDDRVVVRGTASGADACYTARLAGVAYEDGTLTVRVETYSDADEGTACAQCLVDVAYAATVTFEGGLPDGVIVTHDGERVTTADRSGG